MLLAGKQRKADYKLLTLINATHWLLLLFNIHGHDSHFHAKAAIDSIGLIVVKFDRPLEIPLKDLSKDPSTDTG